VFPFVWRIDAPHAGAQTARLKLDRRVLRSTHSVEQASTPSLKPSWGVMGHGVSLLFFQNLFSLQIASKYTLLFQQREGQSAMLEEAPGRVAFLTRSLTRDRAKKIDLLAIVAKTRRNA
jgi:hypothetical protein